MLRQLIEQQLNVTLKDIKQWKNNTYKAKSENFINIINDFNKFIIIGDYDCDGICASYICRKSLKDIKPKSRVKTILPSRTDGYGITPPLEEKVIKLADKDTCIITVDTGITANFEKIKKTGATIILTDHHKSDVCPDNIDLCVDPNAEGSAQLLEGYNYCGAGVIYKLFEQHVSEECRNIIIQYAALAQIADVIIMREEGWNLTYYGLEEIKKKPDIAIKYLIDFNEIKYFDTNSVGFYVAPCINSCGRMYSEGANIVFNYFMKPDKTTAFKIINTNNKRKELQKIETNKAFKYIKENNLKNVEPIIVPLEEVKSGIIGLVASGIVNKYNSSAIVLTNKKNDVYSGSCRAYEDFDIYGYLQSQSNNLLSFGGHKSAAGLALTKENIQKLKTEEILEERKPSSRSYINIGLFDIENLWDIIQDYVPLGAGFNIDIFRIKIDLEKVKYSYIKGAHLKINNNIIHFNHNPEVTKFYGYGSISWNDYSSAPQMIINNIEEIN